MSESGEEEDAASSSGSGVEKYFNEAGVESISKVLSEEDLLEYDECIEKIKKISEDSDYTGEEKAAAIIKTLQTHFEYVDEYRDREKVIGAFPSFLKLLAEFENYNKIYTGRDDSSMVHHIFNTFYEFLKDQGDYCADEILYQQVHEQDWKNSLRIVSNFKASTYLDRIEYIFQLKNLQCEDSEDILNEVVEVINRLLNASEYERAIHWIAHFKLHEIFIDRLPELAFYCFQINNRPLIERYLLDQYELQERLMTYMDNLIDFSEFHGAHYKSLSPKTFTPFEWKYLTTDIENTIRARNDKIMKLTFRYARKWDIKEENIPYSMLARAFKFIVYKHYDFLNGHISEQSYDDTVIHMAEEKEEVQGFLLEYLSSGGYYMKALFLALLLNIPDAIWPSSLKSFEYSHPVDVLKVKEDVQMKRQTIEDQRRQHYEQCYLFENNTYPIYMIDTKDLLNAVIEDVFDLEIVGIDVEWRPSGLSIREIAALLQIATTSTVYLIDIVKLEKILTQEDWENFFTKVFCHSDLKKIGFAFHNDLRVLIHTFPWLKKYIDQIAASSICLQSIISQVVLNHAAFKSVFPGYDRPPQLNLAELSRNILDIRLDKSEQQGNWAQRPLRVEQKKYAAMDAHCLIKLYKEICKRLEMGIEDLEIINGIFYASRIIYTEKKHIPPPLPRPKGEKREKQPITDQELDGIVKKIRDELSYDSDARRVQDVQLIVDNMINHIGKELRNCGIHTTLVSNRAQLIEHANRKKKTEILTMGKAYDQLRPMFPGRVHSLPVNLSANQSKAQQIEFVLRELKIKVYEEDYFTRCMKCNATQFVNVPGPIIKYMFMRYIMTKDLDFMPKYTTVDAKEARKALQHISAADYGGLKCAVKFFKDEEMTLITAVCEHGNIDISNRLVIGTASSIGPVKIKLHYSLANVIDTPGRIFAICHQCGGTFYEGSHSIRKLEQLKLSSQKKRSDDNVTLVAVDDKSGTLSVQSTLHTTVSESQFGKIL